MHKTLSLGYTRAETEDCDKFFSFADKNVGYTPGGYTSGITALQSNGWTNLPTHPARPAYWQGSGTGAIFNENFS